MTVRTLTASIPPVLIIPGMQLKLEAIDPASGLAVTGVTSSQWAIYGDTEDDATGDTESGPFMLVPGPTPVGDASAALTITGGV